MERMIRFQIYLTQLQKELLDEESRTTGKSIAEIVREIIDEKLDG